MTTPFVSSTKTVLVMGGSYGGRTAAKVLAKGLPEGYRVVLLERNSHANHLYVIPRFCVLGSHESKAFIPYNYLYGPDPVVHKVVHGTATRLEPNRVTYTPASYSPDPAKGNQTIEFDYMVYALGAKLPGPIDFWGAKDVYEKQVNFENEEARGRFNGTKPASIEFLQRAQIRLKGVQSVLVVGGGALGIQFATDLKDMYPQKQITLLHSRMQLLPKFPEKMHNEITKTMHRLGVSLILGQRLDLGTTLPDNTEYDEKGRRVVKTESGKRICADLVLLCTGQAPNTALMRDLAPQAVDANTGLVKVLRTMQVDLPHSTFVAQDEMPNQVTTMPHIYAIGDAADAFGAIKAGHTAHSQAEIASRNILAPISGSPLVAYEPGPPAIKLSLGMRHRATIMGAEQTMTVGDDGKDDLDAPSMWPYVGADFERDRDL
ncbi:unnamed protein product [Rhizoctonia solani]|uniref:FAD/NAD(P)-binding domain-containing protein n=3 Tax=Rhizoctonia solani TaxID=456999 RepID=A0A8H3CV11_9AGAM|nr:apoptosis-inducing factor 2 [Rhizoctonia solani AG-3 Rhs1AP]KEP48286.1 apoptosis-inducing factor 2 [Rhizoctonia solani 123E]CAE6486334.1 unnamed protein product [Rhizoctonia solani]CAE6501499.1 unnamed protein product [Rhizoctonia solani]